MSHLSIEVNSGEHSCLPNCEHFLTWVLNSSHLLKDFHTDPGGISCHSMACTCWGSVLFSSQDQKTPPTTNQPTPPPAIACIHVTIFSGIPGYLAPWFVQPGNRLFVVLSQTTCGGNKGSSMAEEAAASVERGKDWVSFLNPSPHVKSNSVWDLKELISWRSDL